MKLVILLFNVTPQAFSHQTCLPKYMTMSIGPGFLQPKSWLLKHHDWTSSYIVWEQMCTYQDNDATIVQVVRESLLKHLWYLTEHLVISAFLWVCGSWFEGSYGYTTTILYPPIPEHALKISLEIHGDASPEHAEYLLFIWITCYITNYSLMSLNVTITHPITLYLLEQYSIPLKPVLGGRDNCNTFH